MEKSIDAPKATLPFVSVKGTQRETGEALFTGGGQDDQMSRVQNFQTPVVVNGRIFVAANDRVYAFTSR